VAKDQPGLEDTPDERTDMLIPDAAVDPVELLGLPSIALCRTLTDEPDLLNRVISSLESAVLDEIVGRQEKNEPLNPADLSESIVGAITEMLSEAFSMSWAFAASLVERHYTGCTHPHKNHAAPEKDVSASKVARAKHSAVASALRPR
jgi:hypothetical protein